MLATLGYVVLWTLAVFGFIAACGVIGAISDGRKAKRSPTQPEPEEIKPTEVAPEPPKPELLYRVVITRKDALR